MRKLSSKLAGQQSGFTLIELVIVIVIIGILAAVAIPNFANLSDDAKIAKANATAGALASWASANAARCEGKLSPTAASGDQCVNTAGKGLLAAGLSGTVSGNADACIVTIDGKASDPVKVKAAATSC